MLFNFSETSYKVGCWAITAEVLGEGWSTLFPHMYWKRPFTKAFGLSLSLSN